MHNVLILHSETISFYVTRRQKSPKDRFELRESIRFIYCYFLKEESAELRDLGIHSLAKSIRIFNKHMLFGTLSTSPTQQWLSGQMNFAQAFEAID